MFRCVTTKIKDVEIVRTCTQGRVDPLIFSSRTWYQDSSIVMSTNDIGDYRRKPFVPYQCRIIPCKFLHVHM